MRQRLVHQGISQARSSTAKADVTMRGPTLVGWIRGLGYQRVIARSDIELGVLALLRDVSIALLDVELVERASPQEDHQRHGLAEARYEKWRAKREFRSATWKLDGSGGCKATNPSWHGCCDMQHHVINRGRTGADGRTLNNEEWAKGGPRVQSCSVRLAS